MGNCLKRAGGNQQDNTTLLSNPDPALTSGSSQEALEPPILYNEVVPPYYQPITSRDRHLQSSHLNFNHGLGVNLGLGCPASLSEEEQIKIAKRLGLIQNLPLGRYDGIKKGECVICMIDLVVGEQVRYLPCMHTYHAVCIDDWLMRSLTCPSCMEPVDSALLNSYPPTT